MFGPFKDLLRKRARQQDSITHIFLEVAPRGRAWILKAPSGKLAVLRVHHFHSPKTVT
jgi:hypothetical protein